MNNVDKMRIIAEFGEIVLKPINPWEIDCGIWHEKKESGWRLRLKFLKDIPINQWYRAHHIHGLRKGNKEDTVLVENIWDWFQNNIEIYYALCYNIWVKHQLEQIYKQINSLKKRQHELYASIMCPPDQNLIDRTVIYDLDNESST